MMARILIGATALLFGAAIFAWGMVWVFHDPNPSGDFQRPYTIWVGLFFALIGVALFYGGWRLIRPKPGKWYERP